MRLLDHGYIEAVEHWGSDERIIEAARMSTDKGLLGWGLRHSDDCVRELVGKPKAISIDTCCKGQSGDEKLLRYLWEHKHATPFEMAGLTIEVQAPIFVFREWHRHRTQSFNELSARYTPMPNLNYLPTYERFTGENEIASGNKQAGTAGGAERIQWDDSREYAKRLENFYDTAESFYQEGLRLGVPKELARLCVPVGRYSRMRASANLRNWLAFLTLRNDPAAQWEIRQYAIALQEILAERFPRTLAIFAGSR